jgi:hypothetical protein
VEGPAVPSNQHPMPIEAPPYPLSSRPERSEVEGSAVPIRHASLRSAQVRFVCSISHILRPSPSLNLLFPIKSVTDVLITFEPDESIALVNLSETRNRGPSMLLHSTLDAIGYSAIENVRSTGDNVNVVVVLSSAHLKTHSLSIENRRSLHYASLRSGRQGGG